MQTYLATTEGPMNVSGYIDPDDVTIVEVFWGAPAFVADTIYKVGEIVRPTIANGYYYTVVKTGKAAATEPTWLLGKTTSGNAVFKPISYDLFIGEGDIIVASAWVATSGVTITSEAFTDERTSVKVTSVQNTLTTFDLTNKVTKNDVLLGEKLTRTFRYTVNEQ